MNYARSTKYVKKIVDSKDNIIDQLKELSKFKYRKGVRHYIDELILANTLNDYDLDSKYILYCIVKYYYGLDVQDGDEPLIIPDSLGIITPATYDIDYIEELLNTKDNIIDECKVLKEHQDNPNVQKYISHAITYFGCDAPARGLSTEYEMYCINKYFYGYDVPLVKSNHVRLGVWPKLRKSKKPNLEESMVKYTPFEEIKKGDKVKILTGPFTGIQAIIMNIDLDNNHIEATINLFEEDYSIELTEDDRVLKEKETHE